MISFAEYLETAGFRYESIRIVFLKVISFAGYLETAGFRDKSIGIINKCFSGMATMSEND